jgi:hypothetical protein
LPHPEPAVPHLEGAVESPKEISPKPSPHFSGVTLLSIEGRIDSFRWGLDNRFHISTGLDSGEVRPGNKPDARPI